MSGLFGEIVHPSSRAFWNEDDEEDDVGFDDAAKFTLEWTQDIPIKINTLIVAETHLIVDFVKDYVLNTSENICNIKLSGSKNPSGIFKINDNLYVCTVSADVDLTVAGDFVESIHDVLMKTDNIIALTCNHISQLKTSVESLEPSFMRSLSTKKASDLQKKFSPALKQPNIVSGVSAGVVAYSEAMNLSATLNVLYLDGFEFDSETIQPLINIFEKLIKIKVTKFTTKKTNFNKGNLYM